MQCFWQNKQNILFMVISSFSLRNYCFSLKTIFTLILTLFTNNHHWEERYQFKSQILNFLIPTCTSKQLGRSSSSSCKLPQSCHLASHWSRLSQVASITDQSGTRIASHENGQFVPGNLKSFKTCYQWIMFVKCQFYRNSNFLLIWSWKDFQMTQNA